MPTFKLQCTSCWHFFFHVVREEDCIQDLAATACPKCLRTVEFAPKALRQAQIIRDDPPPLTRAHEVICTCGRSVRIIVDEDGVKVGEWVESPKTQTDDSQFLERLRMKVRAQYNTPTNVTMLEDFVSFLFARGMSFGGASVDGIGWVPRTIGEFLEGRK